MATNSTLYIMESANLFCGDTDPTKSKHLALDSIKLPTLEEDYQEHKAGGALAAIGIPVGIKKPDATFKLAGWDPDVLQQFGLFGRSALIYTAYGVIRDKRSGNALEAKAIMQGRLGKIEPDAYKRGDLMGHDHMIDGITSYQLYFNGAEQIYWDFFASIWRVGGVDQNADTNSILRIS